MRTWRKFWVVLLLVFVFCIAGFPGEKFKVTPHDSSYFSGPIFVLLYHPWEEDFESVFRDHLGWLKRNGYQTISFETLIDYLEGKELTLPLKPIVLTFDDGTIENYHIVYPILQEFGYMGTAFVITGPPFAPYSNKFWWKGVDRSGILRVESHSHTHSLIQISSYIVDFYSGEDDSGYYYLIKGMDTRLGAPIYEFGYELVNDRYFPDRRIANLCVAYVNQNGGEDFLKREAWKEELLQVVDHFRDRYQERGAYEKEVQKNLRMRGEIYRSKKLIEQMIGGGEKVEFYAYPWGVYDEELVLHLKTYGFRGAFTSEFGGNFPGDDPFKIKRLLVTSEMTVQDLANILAAE